MSQGDWNHALPSERALAEEYLVSRTTLRRALAVLHDDGLVSPCGSTREGRVVLFPKRAKAGKRQGDLVVVLTSSLGTSSLLLEHLAILRELLGRNGVRVEVNEAARLAEMGQPKETLARLAARNACAVWVLHKMPLQVQSAAQALGLPCVIYGSAFEGISLPCIDVDFHAVARHAAGRCLAKGMSRLALLVHRTNLAGDAIIVGEITALLAKAGAPAPMVLRHDFNRSRLIDALDLRIVPPGDRPDALLIVNQDHLVTALPHLLHRGLRIPEDISLLYLSNDPLVERFSPLPDRYDLGTLLTRRLARAAQALLAGEPAASCHLLPKMLTGETFTTQARRK